MDSKLHNHYYLMRHGESVANSHGLIVSSPANALNGYGLTRQGAGQVTESARQASLARDTIIVSSDFRRARETAELMRKTTRIAAPVQIDESLRERDFGDWELHDQAGYQTVWKHDVERPLEKIDRVERVIDVLSRARSVITRLQLEHRQRSILLVSHGDVLQILLAFHRQLNPQLHRRLPAIKNAEVRNLADSSRDKKGPYTGVYKPNHPSQKL